MTRRVQTVLPLKGDRLSQRDSCVLLRKRQLQSQPAGNESIRVRSLPNLSLFSCAHPADPRSRAAAGAFSRAGPVHVARPEASVWTGLSRTSHHAYAVWLRREPHAGSGPAGGVRAHAITDGPRRQLPWYGWNGGHGASSSQHDETPDDERQQAHEAAAAAEAAGTTGTSSGRAHSI